MPNLIAMSLWSIVTVIDPNSTATRSGILAMTATTPTLIPALSIALVVNSVTPTTIPIVIHPHLRVPIAGAAGGRVYEIHVQACSSTMLPSGSET